MINLCWNTHTAYDKGNKMTPSCSPPSSTVTHDQLQYIPYSATQHLDKLSWFRLTRSFIRETMNRRYVLISCLLVFFFLILCQRKTGPYYYFKFDFKVHPPKILSASQHFFEKVTLDHSIYRTFFFRENIFWEISNINTS